MVQTTKMMINSIGEVANLMGRDEWGMGFISHSNKILYEVALESYIHLAKYPMSLFRHLYALNFDNLSLRANLLKINGKKSPNQETGMGKRF